MKVVKLQLRGINYGAKLLPMRFGFEHWTPAWHKGRGEYVTIGLWLVALYRGY